ncbi:MAG: hypothetical protein CMG35_00320 [Candidatus Marinimicrobia bacterium]|nr:hypothetical protein [Candidatus Neomarinimicrobiota bacterium]|tara:strand:- start:196 stop:381 length:186 start_codon:yes stop_codon:yes gene_type:complete
MSTHSKNKKEMTEGGMKTTTFKNVATRIKTTSSKLLAKAANVSPQVQTLNLYDAEMDRRNK